MVALFSMFGCDGRNIRLHPCEIKRLHSLNGPSVTFDTPSFTHGGQCKLPVAFTPLPLAKVVICLENQPVTTITELIHRLVIGALSLGASAFSAALTGGASKRTLLSRLLLFVGLNLLGTQIVGARDQFLLLNYSPNGFATYHSSATIMNNVAQKFGPSNQASSLRVRVAWRPGHRWRRTWSETTDCPPTIFRLA
jgi:hypothetical protein